MRSDDITIPEPCHAAWDQMRPEQRGRFCFDCRKKVHDLSTMTEAEAERFLEQSADQDICVSYQHSDDGVIEFRTPAPIVPLSRLSRRPSRRAAVAAVATAGLAATLAACAPHGEGPKLRETEEVRFSAPTVVIPHEQTNDAVPPPPPEVTPDEPCDPVTTPTDPPEVERPRVKGRMPIRRTAGKPVMRKTGKKMPSMPV